MKKLLMSAFAFLFMCGSAIQVFASTPTPRASGMSSLVTILPKQGDTMANFGSQDTTKKIDDERFISMSVEQINGVEAVDYWPVKFVGSSNYDLGDGITVYAVDLIPETQVDFTNSSVSTKSGDKLGVELQNHNWSLTSGATTQIWVNWH